MARRMTATVRSRLAAGVTVLPVVALLGVPGEPAEYLAAGPDGVTGGTEIRTDEAASLRVARETGGPVRDTYVRQSVTADRDTRHPTQNPHINFETYRNPIGPGRRGGRPVSNHHVYLPEEKWWHPCQVCQP